MAEIKKVEYHPNLLYKIAFDFTIYSANGGRDNIYEKDEQFLCLRDNNRKVVFMSLTDQSLLGLGVVRKLNRTHKKPVLIFFKDVLKGVRI